MSLQAKYHLCSAGWIESGRVAYPIAFASQNCGSGIVGIVDYGPRNTSEMWDVFCYRMKGNYPKLHFRFQATQLLSHARPGQPMSKGEVGSWGLCPTGRGPHVLLPSRCELHLQEGLRGRWLLMQWEPAAGPDVLPLTHKLPDGTYHVCLFSPRGKRGCLKAGLREVSP